MGSTHILENRLNNDSDIDSEIEDSEYAARDPYGYRGISQNDFM